MNLQLVGAILEGIALRVDFSRQLSGLAGRNEARSQAIGHRRADEEPSRLRSHDLRDTLAKKVLRHGIDACGEAPLVGNEWRDVLEDDSGFGIVRDVYDEVLIREWCLVGDVHVVPPDLSVVPRQIAALPILVPR